PIEDGPDVEQEILFPPNPGSIYHMTKTQDQLLFAYYNKNDGVRVTDLHQGIVWGTQTSETQRGERVRIFNQMTESHRLIELAQIVSKLTGADIDFVENPRNEAAENDLYVENRQLLNLGLHPITLEDRLLLEVSEF